MPRHEIVVVFKDDRAPGVLEQPFRRGALLDHRAVGSKVAVENHRSSLGLDRVVERPDDIPVVTLGRSNILPHRLAGYGNDVAVQQRLDLLHDDRNAARVEHVLPSGAFPMERRS